MKALTIKHFKLAAVVVILFVFAIASIYLVRVLLTSTSSTVERSTSYRPVEKPGPPGRESPEDAVIGRKWVKFPTPEHERDCFRFKRKPEYEHVPIALRRDGKDSTIAVYGPGDSNPFNPGIIGQDVGGVDNKLVELMIYDPKGVITNLYAVVDYYYIKVVR